VDGFQVCPFILQVFLGICKEGSVDEILIDIVQLQFLEGKLECLLGVLDFGAGDFGCNVELFAGNTCFLDCFAELDFVAVD
jgi:hypothetical protein